MTHQEENKLQFPTLMIFQKHCCGLTCWFFNLKKRAKKEHALILHGIPANSFFLIYWHELHLLHRRENIFNIDFMLFSIVFFVHISGHLIKAY